MLYQVIVKPRALKQLEKLEKKDQVRIIAATKDLAINPFLGKKLHGDHEGQWSIRAWPFRIIYTIDKKIITVTVVAIGDRKDVYR